MQTLVSFKPADAKVTVSASITRAGDGLNLFYLLKDLDGIVQDSLSRGRWKNWSRADGLWQSTCFEAFFAQAGNPTYWEVNLSPAKQAWNLYRFEDYRKPAGTEPNHDFELSEVVCDS